MPNVLIYVLIHFAGILIIALQFCMLGRAVLSWFSPDEENGIARFLFLVTEPFLVPIRKLIGRIEFFNNVPIDMSFIIAFVILIILQAVLRF